MPDAAPDTHGGANLRAHVARGLCLAVLLALGACGAAESHTADAESLRASFAAQIATLDTVGDFEREGGEMTFSGPDGSGGEVAWRVVIDSAVVGPWDDESLPYRGVVLSSWYADGEEIQSAGSISNLPSEFLDTGIAQDCWGLWDAAERHWTW